MPDPVARAALGLHELRCGDATAVVSERAAALRLLRIDGDHLVEPTIGFTVPPGMAGAVLVPWPNRVEGARWTHEGKELALAVTEPEFGHANHGLLSDRDYLARRSAPWQVQLSTRIAHETGYPFELDVLVDYRLHESGIAARIRVRNHSAQAAPVAVGAHPYLRLGSEPIDAVRLSVDADTLHLLDERHIPCARIPVDGTQWDLRHGRTVADTPSHATFERSAGDGSVRHTLAGPSGRRVELWGDAAFRFTQVYRADQLETDDGVRAAIAVEPMTAPPNGLRSGTGMRLIAPRESWSVSFGIRLGHDELRSR